MGLEEVEVEGRKNLEGEEEGEHASGLKMKPVSRPTHVPLKSSILVQWRWVKCRIELFTCTLVTEAEISSLKVFESRGMQVCEEAVKLLKNGKRKPIKVIIHFEVTRNDITFSPSSGHSAYLRRWSEGG